MIDFAKVSSLKFELGRGRLNPFIKLPDHVNIPMSGGYIKVNKEANIEYSLHAISELISLSVGRFMKKER